MDFSAYIMKIDAEVLRDETQGRKEDLHRWNSRA
jgi:hypothetical protein